MGSGPAGPAAQPLPAMKTPGTASSTIPSPGPSGPGLLGWLYLGLAIAGGVLPWLANLAFLREHGPQFDLRLFVGMANANPAAQSLSRDLAIGATAVTIWMVSEARRIRLRGLPWVLLSCITIAFAFGAPLFLHLRERRLRELERNGGISG